MEQQPLIMECHGFREETYYTYSYTPSPDDQGTAGGIFCAISAVIGGRHPSALGKPTERVWPEIWDVTQHVRLRHPARRTGLRIDCRAAAEPAYVDRDMWEKIVMNLLSNAFKFTLSGEIAVSMRQRQRLRTARPRHAGPWKPRPMERRRCGESTSARPSSFDHYLVTPLNPPALNDLLGQLGRPDADLDRSPDLR